MSAKEKKLRAESSFLESFWSQVYLMNNDKAKIQQMYESLAKNKKFITAYPNIIKALAKFTPKDEHDWTLLDTIQLEIYKLRFKIRDVEDAKNNIKRPAFHPEKLVGKTLHFKPYPTENVQHLKVLSIACHYPDKSLDTDMVVYMIDDGVEKPRRFPIYQIIIQSMIDTGEFRHKVFDMELTYKLV